MTSKKSTGSGKKDMNSLKPFPGRAPKKMMCGGKTTMKKTTKKK